MGKKFDKFVLYKMRNILIKEMNRGYYQNAANVKEFVNLEGNDEIIDVNEDKYIHKKNICYYQNGMFTFNDFYVHFSGFYMPNIKAKKRKRY